MEIIFLTHGQGEVFLGYLAAGLLCGIFYSLFRGLRFLLGGGMAATVTTDIGWGVASGAFLASAGAVINHGQLRVFTLLGVVLGLFCYWRLVHKPLAIFLSIRYTSISPRLAKTAKRAEARRIAYWQKKLQKSEQKQALRKEQKQKKQALRSAAIAQRAKRDDLNHQQKARSEQTRKKKRKRKDKTKDANKRVG